MIKKLLKKTVEERREQRKAELYRNLIRHEAKIGGKLFGPIAPGGRREFFCLDANTWVWHEEWVDRSGQRQAKTTHYSVRPDAVLKTVDGSSYQVVSPDEAYRLYQAAKTYRQKVNQELYSAIA